jgi:hypothetical protein
MDSALVASERTELSSTRPQVVRWLVESLTKLANFVHRETLEQRKFANIAEKLYDDNYNI